MSTTVHDKLVGARYCERDNLKVQHKIQEKTGVFSGGTDGGVYTAAGEFFEDYHRVPNLNANQDGDFNVNLGNFEKPWNRNNLLLCFSDYEKPQLMSGWGFLF